MIGHTGIDSPDSKGHSETMAGKRSPRLDPAAFRRRRVEAGLTQRQLSDQSGVSLSFIKLIERGETNPSRAFQTVLAAAMKCEPSDFMRTVDEHDAA